MNEVEIFINQRNELVVKLYAAPNSVYNDSTLIGKDAYIFMEEMAKYPIKNIIESGDQNYAFFEYSHFNVTMKNYMDILYSSRANSLNKTIKLYFEKKNLEKRKKKKVNRKNKHTGKKIVTMGLTFLMLAIGARGVAKQKDNLQSSIIEAGNFQSDMSYNVVSQIDSDIPEISSVNYEEEVKNLSVNIEESENLENVEQNQVANGAVVETIENKSEDLNTVSINYEDRSSTNKAGLTKSNYGEIIKKYSKMYGLDSKLVTAIATQERGVHSSTMDKGGATGLMQIQNSVWIGNTVTAYNFDTNSEETVSIDFSKIANVDTNIKIGCMVFQNMLKRMDYNILAAIQSYNMGNGNVNKILTDYSVRTNRSKQDILNDKTDCGWLNHRDLIKVGDQNYVENVLSWIGPDVDIHVTKPDGTVVNLNVNNQDTIMKMSR